MHRVRSHDEKSVQARRKHASDSLAPATVVNTETFPWLAVNPVVHDHRHHRASASIDTDDYLTCYGDDVSRTQPSRAIYATSVPSGVNVGRAPGRRHTPMIGGDAYEEPAPVHKRHIRLDRDQYVSDRVDTDRGDGYEDSVPVSVRGPTRLDRDLYVLESRDVNSGGVGTEPKSTVPVSPSHYAAFRPSAFNATSTNHQISRPRHARDSNA